MLLASGSWLHNKDFFLDYRYNACKPGMKEQVIDMAINGSGIRDTACVLRIHKHTVISTLKKVNDIVQVNPNFYTEKAWMLD